MGVLPQFNVISVHDDVIKWKYFPRYWTCAGNSPVTGEVPSQKPVMRSFDVFFDLCMNKRLSKQWWGWYLRRHRAHYEVIVMVYLLAFYIPICNIEQERLSFWQISVTWIRDVICHIDNFQCSQWRKFRQCVISDSVSVVVHALFQGAYAPSATVSPANIARNKYVTITSNRRFDETTFRRNDVSTNRRFDETTFRRNDVST